MTPQLSQTVTGSCGVWVSLNPAAQNRRSEPLFQPVAGFSGVWIPNPYAYVCACAHARAARISAGSAIQTPLNPATPRTVTPREVTG